MLTKEYENVAENLEQDERSLAKFANHEDYPRYE